LSPVFHPSKQHAFTRGSRPKHIALLSAFVAPSANILARRISMDATRRIDGLPFAAFHCLLFNNWARHDVRIYFLFKPYIITWSCIV